jgi:adenosine deaminase
MKTGALARLLRREDAAIEDHPLPALFRHGIPVVLSTDDPAMFHTTLREEYANAARMGLQEEELARIVEMGFEQAFLPAGERRGA